MINRRTGKWSTERANLRRVIALLQGMLNKIPLLNVQSIQSIPQIIDKSQNNILSVQKAIRDKKHSFFDFRLDEIYELIDTCLVLITTYANAFKSAEKLSKQHAQSVERARAHSNPKNNIYRSVKKNPLFTKNAFTLFEHNVTAQHTTWYKLKDHLESIRKIAEDVNAKHNVLSHILTPNDEKFIDLIECGKLPICGELGHIVIQRLKNISISAEIAKNKTMKAKVNRWLEFHANEATKEGIYYYNHDEFKNELIKLALYAAFYPDQKIAWLGTARSVKAYALKYQPIGMYLNCDDEKWTWQLNRGWLQATLVLGYTLKLVEQHFPLIESAILSGDSTQLIKQLAREMRKRGNVSQYNGNIEPTATSQEILALMDLRSVAKKLADSDGNSIVFHPARQYDVDAKILDKPKKSDMFSSNDKPKTDDATTTDDKPKESRFISSGADEFACTSEELGAPFELLSKATRVADSIPLTFNLNQTEDVIPTFADNTKHIHLDVSDVSDVSNVSPVGVPVTMPTDTGIINATVCPNRLVEATEYKQPNSTELSDEETHLTSLSFFATECTPTKLSHSQTIYRPSMPPMDNRRENFTTPESSENYRASIPANG